MLRRRTDRVGGRLRVTFALAEDDPRLPASVVGDFNGWDPAAHPLRRRGNGTWSAVVSLETGRAYRFRYRSASGEWFNDDDADGVEPNEFASTNSVLRV
jgi:1,4-alpha-glucan branching enzyme